MDAVSARSNERDPGRLVVITGLPGSGKTTLATELARSMPATRMCPDDWMRSPGIDLWNDGVRGRIEQCWRPTTRQPDTYNDAPTAGCVGPAFPDRVAWVGLHGRGGGLTTVRQVPETAARESNL